MKRATDDTELKASSASTILWPMLIRGHRVGRVLGINHQPL